MPLSQEEWRKEKTTQYHLRIANSTGIPPILQQAAKKLEMSPIQYIRLALIEKLAKDGYVQLEKVTITRIKK